MNLLVHNCMSVQLNVELGSLQIPKEIPSAVERNFFLATFLKSLDNS